MWSLAKWSELKLKFLSYSATLIQADLYLRVEPGGLLHQNSYVGLSKADQEVAKFITELKRMGSVGM